MFLCLTYSLTDNTPKLSFTIDYAKEFLFTEKFKNAMEVIFHAAKLKW